MADVDTRLRVDNTDAARGISAFKRDLASIPRAATQAAQRATRGIRGNIDRQFEGLRRNARDLRTVITEFAIGFGLGGLARDLFHVNNQLLSAKNALGAFTADAKATDGELRALQGTSQKLGTDLLMMTDQWTKLRAATASSAIPTREIYEIFQGLAESSRVLNLDAKRTEGVFRAIIQMFSKGKVQAEELRGQLGEHIPGAFEMAAKSMGVTTKELDKMISDGKVFADDLVPKLAQQMRDTFGKALPAAMKTSQADLERLRNTLKIFVQQNQSQIEGAFKTLIAIPQWLVDHWGPAIDKVSLWFVGLVPVVRTVLDTILEITKAAIHVWVKVALWPIRWLLRQAAESSTKFVPDAIRIFATETTKLFDDMEKSVAPDPNKPTLVDRIVGYWANMDEIYEITKQQIAKREELRKRARETGNLDALIEEVFGSRGGLPRQVGLSEEQLKALGEVRNTMDGIIKITEEYNRIKQKIIDNTVTAEGEIVGMRGELLDLNQQFYIRDVANHYASLKKKEADLKSSMGDQLGALKDGFEAQILEARAALAEGVISEDIFIEANQKFQKIFEIDKQLVGTDLRSTYDEAFGVYADYLQRMREIWKDASEDRRDEFLQRNKEMYASDLNEFLKSELAKKQSYLDIMGDRITSLQNEMAQSFHELEMLRAENIISDDELVAAQERLARIFQIDSNSFLAGMRGELELMGESLDNIRDKVVMTFGELAGNSINQMADAIGNAVAHGEDLSESLRQIGRDIVSSIISSLIKMGTQMLINHMLGKALGQAALSASMAQAAASTAAWATPAYLASVATLGGAAAVGGASLAAGAATSSALMSALQSASGSLFGGGRAFGGPVSRDKYYRVGEGGGGSLPEIFKSGGKQFLIPPEDGRVEPMRTMDFSVPAPTNNVFVNIENAPPGAQVNQNQTNRGLEVDIVFKAVDKRMADGLISGGSETATALERVYGIPRNKGRL